MFGADIQPFEQAAYWRTWHNMQSLIERGLDPLTVLIDRAHDHNMDFWASLRMAAYGNMDPAHRLADGGGGLAHAEVRAHILQVVEELATEYETDGVELDFALPGGAPRILREEDVEATTPILTDYVEQLAERVRGQRSGRGRSAGVAHRGDESGAGFGRADLARARVGGFLGADPLRLYDPRRGHADRLAGRGRRTRPTQRSMAPCSPTYLMNQLGPSGFAPLQPNCGRRR